MARIIRDSNQVEIQSSFGANVSGTFGTFGSTDTTPSVSGGNIWKTHASSQTLTSFDDGVVGQIITVISTDAVTFDATAGNFKCGANNIVTASGDVTNWVYDGTNWYLINFMNQSENLSAGH